MRILLLSGLKIFPNQSGGHLRSGGIAKALARLGHDVCIYSLAGRREDYGQGQTMLRQSIEENLIEEVNLSWGIGLLQAVSRRLSLPRFWQYVLLRMGLIPAGLKTRLDWAELVVCDFPYCPPIPGPWSEKPWYLISHNLEQRLLAQGPRIERLFAAWMRRVETQAAQRYQAIFACAKEDQDYFRQHSARPESIRLVANGIDPILYQRSQREGLELRQQWGLTAQDWLIVFSGSRFAPNLEALADLRDFCRQEQDFLLQNRLHFLILGSMEAKARREGALIITGPVAATYPYFAASDAALNPVIRGSGSNVKIFEYLAAGLPVISSAFGVRGTALQPTRDFILLEDGQLRPALQSLVSRDKAQGRMAAAKVWEAYKMDCDMTEILRREWKALPPLEDRANHRLTKFP